MPHHWTVLPKISGTHVRQLREALGLTAGELGDALGHDRRTVNKWEALPFVPQSYDDPAIQGMAPRGLVAEVLSALRAAVIMGADRDQLANRLRHTLRVTLGFALAESPGAQVRNGLRKVALTATGGGATEPIDADVRAAIAWIASLDDMESRWPRRG